MKKKITPAIIEKLCLLPLLVLFLLFTGFIYQLPVSSVFAERNPNEIRAGVHRNFPPHYSIDEKTGKPAGFAIDTMDEIARRAGLKVDYILFDDWPLINQALKEGSIDIIPNMGVVKERTAEMDFTKPLETFNIRIFVRSATMDIQGIDSLQGRKVAVVTFNAGLFLIQEYGKATPVIFKSLDEAILSLLSGNTDALVYPEPSVLLAVRRSKLEERIKSVGKPLLELKRAIAVAKGNPELFRILDNEVNAFITTPAYTEIYTKWYGAREPYWNIQRVLIAAGILFALIIYLFIAWHSRSLIRLNRNLRDSIEKQKEAEEALRNQLHFLQQLLDAIPIPIFYKDRQGVFRGCNLAYEKFVGMTKEQIVGKTVFGVAPRDLADIYHQADEALFTQTGAQVYETSFLHADGNRHDIIFNKATYAGADGCVTGLVGVILDITERKRAQEALWESEVRLHLAQDAAKAGAWEWDLRTNENVWSEEVWKLYGLEPHCCEPTYETWRQTVHPDDREKVEQAVQEAAANGTDLDTEWRVPNCDGSFRWLMSRGRSLHDAERRSTRYIGIVMDITERKLAEEKNRTLAERLQRAEKMEALGQLAGGVAHDLNNVLGILSGYSELLMEEIPEGHRSRAHVGKILQSTEKGAAIIQDLLTLARRGVTASEVINLNSIVSGFLKAPAFEKMKDYNPRVTFRTELDKNLLNIKGSPIHLEKTLMNLVSNAAESISGEGEVTIRTESRYLDKPVRGYDEIKEGDYAVLIVSDTGMGIPAENREKVFEPFYTKKAMGRSGTGLGLAIVWGTVKDHNGYIDIQTAVGEGSTFLLYFPVTREELIAQQQKVPIERYLAKGESVLVVDDIAEQRDIASSLLTRLGYEVQVVSSGEEAVEYLKGNRADILVLDMIMAPGIDGLETYEQVLEINPKQKAILVSGFSETDRIRDAQKLGAGAYVKKPYVMERIGMAIRDELKRQHAG